MQHSHTLAVLSAILLGISCVTVLAPRASAQVAGDVRPGDHRIRASRIAEHEATHRFIQYGESGQREVGRLSRRVERVNHTEHEPSILVSAQFRSPIRSGLDIVYVDASTLAVRARYLTAPTGMMVLFQEPGRLHVTYSDRGGGRLTADTTLGEEWFSGFTDLLLASLDISIGERVTIPEIDGGARTVAQSLRRSEVTRAEDESLNLPGVWSGDVTRFDAVRYDGVRITYWISSEAPHLIRQDFTRSDGSRFLRWELTR